MIRKKDVDLMVADALDGYPLEACGLLSGSVAEGGTAQVHSVYPMENAARSARVYSLDPKAMMMVDREVEAAGGQLVGVYHSHTHTEPKPSPTDIEKAYDSDWHYVLVSLRDVHPSVRSWKIHDGEVEEEEVVLEW